MYNLWSYLAHNLSKLRIVMQVKVAVECHWRDDHAVAACVEAFKYPFTSIVAAPIFRCDQRQFNAWTFRQFFEFALGSARDQRLRDHQYTHLISSSSSSSCSVDRSLHKKKRFQSPS